MDFKFDPNNRYHTKLKERITSGDLSEHISWYKKLGYTYLGINRVDDRLTILMQHTCGNIQNYLPEQIKSHVQCNNKECFYSRVKETNKKKYGDTNYFKTDEFKQKSKQSQLERYGKEHYSQTDEGKERIKESYKDTMQQTYGVDNYFQTQEFQNKRNDKIEEVMLDKYGVKSYSQTNEFKDKLKQTSIERYGVEHPTQLKEVKDKIRNTTLSKYGVSTSLMLNQNIYTSDIQKYLVNLFKSWGLTVFENVYMYNDNMSSNVDIYIPSRNIAIEYNGTHWHATLNPFDNRRLLEYNYHMKKSIMAENKGIFLYHLFEFDWFENRDKIEAQLKQLLCPDKLPKIHAKSCYIKQVSYEQANTFLQNNHVQGRTVSPIRLGLFLSKDKKGLSRDTLVALMTFGKSTQTTYHKYIDYDLTRFCTINNYQVYEAASTLFNKFIQDYKPKSIISYSDISHTTGRLYNLLGFKLDSYNEPSYYWTNKERTYKRRQCQKQHLYKIFPDEQLDLTKTENQIMLEHGFYKVYDAGKRIHIWYSNSY